MYISLWENSRGHPDNVSFMQFSTKIDGFEQKYSQGFENSYNSYEQYPLEKFFIFTLPKLYFGFNSYPNQDCVGNLYSKYGICTKTDPVVDTNLVILNMDSTTKCTALGA